jgi:hypothetical protein
MSITCTNVCISDFEEKRIGVLDFVVIYSFWRLITRLLLSPKFVMLQDFEYFSVYLQVQILSEFSKGSV